MRIFVTMAAVGLALAGCTKPRVIEIEDAWVRMPAVPSRPGAAYFTIEGGPADTTLVNVSADFAIRAEMHESMKGSAGMASMRPITSVAIPAATKIAFAPGGRHVMLFDVDQRARQVGAMLLTFTFADGSHMQRKAYLVNAGDPAPDA
ncbi:copper chaperone PCu(A)C [Sphingomonas sp. Leaf17]|uniref:copper chaperone PCu(A)C n=1 Tax=Sphingomonas sp. Leaf17 TaxID=1735683 RepID=UPI000B2DD9A8|nr:copper chaperone PCu(A)C [Sphingomonas sp. Leaf17]